MKKLEISTEVFVLICLILAVAIYSYVKIDRIERDARMAPVFVKQQSQNTENVQNLIRGYNQLKAEVDELKGEKKDGPEE